MSTWRSGLSAARQTTFEQTVTLLFFIALAASACLMPLQNDTWWHLRAGDEMWTRHFVMLRDEFSSTAAGNAWPNHEWLGGVLMYLAFAAGGLPGLTLLAATCVTTAIALSWSLMRGPAVARLLLMALGITSLVSVWTARPLVFSLVLQMIVLHLAIRGISWPLPIIFALWANLHGGVALGFVVLGGAVVADIWMLGYMRGLRRVPWIALCLMATCLTPLGTDLWRTIPESIHKSVANGISEWRAPGLHGRDLGFWLIAGLFLFVLARRGRLVSGREAPLLVSVALLLLPLSLRYSRNITSFVLVALPALSQITQLPAFLAIPRERRERRFMNAGLIAAVLLMGSVAVVRAWSAPAARLQWRPVSARVVRAVRECRGRLYNRFDDGGYLIWFARDVPVFVDSRQDPYPLEFLQEHLHSEESGQFGPVFAKYHLTCAFLPHVSPTAVRLLASGWRLAASDDKWVVLEAAQVQGRR